MLEFGRFRVGQRLSFTERLGWAEDGINGLARLASVDLAGGNVVTADTVVGEPQGIARDGSWALFMRWSATAATRELFRRSADGSETVLASGDLRQASVLEDDTEALLVLTPPKGSGDSYQLIGLDRPDDVRATLPVGPSTSWAAVWQGAP